ncbi:uncharacterized protein [Narcine bancroftii]|uniref:uncharacterized protein n=1 Tax=Narcine bancroftii TaxID=1343680 RepID=UPI003831789C
MESLQFLGHTILAAGAMPAPEKVAAVQRFPQTLHPERSPRVCGDGEFLPSFHSQSRVHHAPIVRAHGHQRKHFIVVRGGEQGVVRGEQGFHCDKGGSSQPHATGAPTAGGTLGALRICLIYGSGGGGFLEQRLDGQWPFTASSCACRSSNSVPSTGSSWRYIWPSAISATSSRAGHSQLSWVTSPSLKHWQWSKIHGPPDSRATSYTCLSSRRYPTQGRQGQCSGGCALPSSHQHSRAQSGLRATGSGTEKQCRDAGLVTAILGLKFKDVWVPTPDTMLCNVSTGMPCQMVPPHWRVKVFNLINNIAHPVVKTTVWMVAEWFVWQELKKEVVELARNCTRCLK